MSRKIESVDPLNYKVRNLGKDADREKPIVFRRFKIDEYIAKRNLDKKTEFKVRQIRAVWNTPLVQDKIEKIIKALDRSGRDEVSRQAIQILRGRDIKDSEMKLELHGIIIDELARIVDSSDLEEILSRRALACAMEGDLFAYRGRVAFSADINYSWPDTGFTALHYAASRDIRKLLKYLIRHPGLNYLVKDAKGRLPSTLAFEIANNSGVGTFLMKKEIKQARAQGIDYREFITEAVQ